MRKAIIDGENATSGIVENIIEVENEKFVLPGKTLVATQIDCEIGASWDGKTFSCQEPDAKDATIARIAALEAKQTPRFMREAVLTDAGRAELEKIDAAIAELRESL